MKLISTSPKPTPPEILPTWAGYTIPVKITGNPSSVEVVFGSSDTAPDETLRLAFTSPTGHPAIYRVEAYPEHRDLPFDLNLLGPLPLIRVNGQQTLVVCHSFAGNFMDGSRLVVYLYGGTEPAHYVDLVTERSIVGPPPRVKPAPPPIFYR